MKGLVAYFCCINLELIIIASPKPSSLVLRHCVGCESPFSSRGTQWWTASGRSLVYRVYITRSNSPPILPGLYLHCTSIFLRRSVSQSRSLASPRELIILISVTRPAPLPFHVLLSSIGTKRLLYQGEKKNEQNRR